MRYQKAKELAECLFNFPYLAPSDVPDSIRDDKELLDIITETYKTTIGPDGKTQQTTIDAAERIRLQAEFKKRIYKILDECLAQEPQHGPALLLYPAVAEYNTRAKDRELLIELYERLLPLVEEINKGTNAYKLIEVDIDGLGGNLFDKVERHLADFHYGLARLYVAANKTGLARSEYNKACKLCPQIYGRGERKIKL